MAWFASSLEAPGSTHAGLFVSFVLVSVAIHSMLDERRTDRDVRVGGQARLLSL